LQSASTSVLLNGVPGKKIHCRRGVRQGDPLSPLLFVSAAELLQCVINHAWQNGEISLPLDNSFDLDCPIVQYADDTLIIMPACPTQLMTLKALLAKFSSSTGLFINFNKSSILPINISTERCHELATLFGCVTESLPFTYLGLPMGTTRQRMDDLIGILQRIDRRLVGIADTLSFDGRLTMVKSIISAIPNYGMCILNCHLASLTMWTILLGIFSRKEMIFSRKANALLNGKRCVDQKKGRWPWCT
jgi:hypothetical protein